MILIAWPKCALGSQDFYGKGTWSDFAKDNSSTLRWAKDFYTLYAGFVKTLLSIHLRNNLTGSLPPIPSFLVATPYVNFAYFVESGLLEGKSSFLLWAADVWRKWDIKPCGEIFSFFSSSNREYYNDLQRHVESKLCCKCLSHGPAKNHEEKMQKVWNSQQQRLTRKYGFVFLWVKVTFMLCFPMRNYKLSKEFWSLACTYKSNLSGTAPVKTILRLKAVRTRAESLQNPLLLICPWCLILSKHLLRLWRAASWQHANNMKMHLCSPCGCNFWVCSSFT